MVERQSMSDSPATVMADYREFVEAKAFHQLHLVLRHGPLGISRMVLPVLGLAAVTVPTQVRNHHGELLGQARCDLAPHDVGLRRTMQE